MSRSPRNWKEMRAARAVPIRAAVSACMTALFAIGAFGISDARAEERTVTIQCPGEKEKKESLKLNESSVTFVVQGCFCQSNKDDLIFELTEGESPISSSFRFHSRIEVAPGGTVKETLFCVTFDQLRESAPHRVR